VSIDVSDQPSNKRTGSSAVPGFDVRRLHARDALDSGIIDSMNHSLIRS
jgi:hypothetical protein